MTIEITKSKLQEWATQNDPDPGMFFKDDYWEQIMFVRDRVPYILGANAEEVERIGKENIKVISTHTSKSIKLPVYEIKLPTQGITFIMRENFNDWKISVISESELHIDFMNLFDETEEISHLYCEGFPEDLVFPPYAQNKKTFTLELYGHYQLHTFLWILKNKLSKRIYQVVLTLEDGTEVRSEQTKYFPVYKQIRQGMIFHHAKSYRIEKLFEE